MKSNLPPYRTEVCIPPGDGLALCFHPLAPIGLSLPLIMVAIYALLAAKPNRHKSHTERLHEQSEPTRQAERLKLSQTALEQKQRALDTQLEEAAKRLKDLEVSQNPDTPKAVLPTVVGGHKSILVDWLRTFERHLLIAAPTGAGKSTLLEWLTSELKRLYPDCTTVAIDPKASQWPHADEIIYLQDEPSDIQRVLNEIDNARLVLKERLSDVRSGEAKEGDFPPYFLILEEWPSISGTLKTAVEPDDKKDVKAIIAGLVSLITKGRSNRVQVIMISQSHLIRDLPISSGVRDSLDIIGLGSTHGGYRMIEKMLLDAYINPSNGEMTKHLEALKPICQHPKQPVFALFSGALQLGVVPYGLNGEAHTSQGIEQSKPTEAEAPKRGDEVSLRVSQGQPWGRIVREVFGLTGGRKYQAKIAELKAEYQP